MNVEDLRRLTLPIPISVGNDDTVRYVTAVDYDDWVVDVVNRDGTPYGEVQTHVIRLAIS